MKKKSCKFCRKNDSRFDLFYHMIDEIICVNKWTIPD